MTMNASAATRLVFFASGVGMSAWAPIVPYAKARAGLDDGELGLLLLCLGIGSVVSMPLSGAAVARWGARRVMQVAAGLMALALPGLALGASGAVLAVALLVFGAGVGLLDVAMNVQAVVVEQRAGRAVMSGFHGLFSVGGIAGSLACVALLHAGLPAWGAVLPVVAVVIAAMAAATPGLIAERIGRDAPAFVVPRGRVLGLGVLTFIVFLTEGAMLDWSAVFLSDVRGIDRTQAGLGYTIFSVAMAIGRLTGDRWVGRLGAVTAVTGGAAAACAGLVLLLTGSGWPSLAVAHALIGLGCSNVVPVLFTAAGRQHAMPANLAMAAVSTLGYAGILCGPALIGFVARSVSLPWALGGVAALMAVLAVSARAVVAPRDSVAHAHQRMTDARK